MSAALAMSGPAGRRRAAASTNLADHHRASTHFPLSQHDFGRISERLDRMTGITMGPDKHTLVHSRLQRRIRALGLKGFRDYCDLLDRPEGQAELTPFVNALTTNLTSFFRESHHFKHLVEETLAPIVPKLRGGTPLRIWSSGCSTGEEPFCIAMMLMSLCSDAYDRNARILATDIDSGVLRTAFRGEYAADRMKGVPDALLRQFFTIDERDGIRTYRANEALRRIVSFRKLNLNAPTWPMRGKFDVIFCRNTLIYFDDARQGRILQRYREVLKPGGHLYLGHSERLSGPAEKAFERVGVTIFRATG
ncbi:MAG: protein-glutamate O-methyltransferase [Pseudomonadota bacterium]